LLGIGPSMTPVTCQSMFGEAMDVWVCGSLGGFVLGRGVFIWHVVQFQVDVLFFKGLKGGLG
jgi:hypothetical protein